MIIAAKRTYSAARIGIDFAVHLRTAFRWLAEKKVPQTQAAYESLLYAYWGYCTLKEAREILNIPAGAFRSLQRRKILTTTRIGGQVRVSDSVMKACEIWIAEKEQRDKSKGVVLLRGKTYFAPSQFSKLVGYSSGTIYIAMRHNGSLRSIWHQGRKLIPESEARRILRLLGRSCTIRTAAEKFGISRSAIFSLLRQQRLRGIRVMTSNRILLSSIDKALAARRKSHDSLGRYRPPRRKDGKFYERR